MGLEVRGLLAGSCGQRFGAIVDVEESLGHQEYFYYMSSPEASSITQANEKYCILFTHSPLDISF